MKLANLHIDRFGARSNLDLEGLSEGLNIVYGPNGSGKTTIIDFIRWMLYGNQAESIRSYLHTENLRASGTLTVCDSSGRRKLQRHDDPSGADRFTVPSSDGKTYGSLLNDVSPDEFSHIFCVCFDRSHDVERLTAIARAHGFQLEHDERQLERIRQLTAQITDHRSQLDRLPRTETAADMLRKYRTEKASEIESVLLHQRQRREELDRQRAALATQAVERDRELEQLRGIANRLAAAIGKRQQRISEQEAEWHRTSSEADEARQLRITEIEGQVRQWQETLATIRQRLQHVRSRISSISDGVPAANENDVSYFLQTLGFRIGDVEQDLTGIYETETWRDHEADATYLRGLLGTAVASMRDDVSRLCQLFDQQRQSAEVREQREELDYLSRCEHELTGLVDRLCRRREQLERVMDAWPFRPTASSWPETMASTIPLESGATISQFRLRHLVERHELAQVRVRDAELSLADLQQQIRQLDAERDRLGDDARVSLLRREIQEIEARLDAIARRQQIQDLIRSMEEEIGRIRQQLRQAEVVERASSFLHRLTGGNYRRIRVGNLPHIEVEDHVSQRFDERQLSSGTRDALYLSLCLALVEAYRKRNIELPIILNDTFDNIDSAGARAMAEILGGFAHRGHQVLVFSRHEHVLDLFRTSEARLYSLRQRASDGSPIETPSITRDLPLRPLSSYDTPRPLPRTSPVAEAPPPVAPEPTYRWVAEWHRHHEPSAPNVPHRPSAPYLPPDTDDLYSSEPKSDLASAFHEGSPLTLVPTLSRELIDSLLDVGIHEVGDFLALSPDEIETRLRRDDITTDVIQRRQREALLQCYVGVSGDESQLLVACGVPDPERLSRADVSVLLRRIETVLKNPDAQVRFGKPADYNVRRIGRWIEAASHSRYRGSVPVRPWAAVETTHPGKPHRSSDAGLQSRDSDAPSRRGRSRPAQKTVPMREPEPLRFFLETSDPVVDAPSIGPKSAERLEAIGINTVSDLLEADAEATAKLIKDRRINGDTFRDWQVQARLVCRVPNLRGHDAQILVACGVTDPQTLAEQNASSLLKEVSRFVNTMEGKRVLRNGKRPDLAEVTAWIEWAESARPLRAA